MKSKLILRGEKVFELEAQPLRSILDITLAAGVPIYHTCGGNGSCSTCRVRILSGQDRLSPKDDMESEILDSFDLQAPHRLACQCFILKDGQDIEVEIPKHDKPPRPNKTPHVPTR